MEENDFGVGVTNKEGVERDERELTEICIEAVVIALGAVYDLGYTKRRDHVRRDLRRRVDQYVVHELAAEYAEQALVQVH